MINSIHIKNFKSVVDLELEIGNFNVIIGENGAGKSNILEGIAFGAAASANKLDFEFLGSRGLRISNPETMFSAFNDLPENKKIFIEFIDKLKDINYYYNIINPENNKWVIEDRFIHSTEVKDLVEKLVFSNSKDKKRAISEIENDFEFVEFIKKLDKITSDIRKYLINDDSKDEIGEKEKNFFKKTFEEVLSKRISDDYISNFIIYSPEQTSLRKFEETNQIYPLGIKGEGIFQYLKNLDISKAKNKKLITEIKKNMLLLDWYEDFEIPDNLLKNETSISIRDRFLKHDLKSFDQRSTNEGFLFILFYSILFCSKDTPSFFAIDNIDSGLNPKLTKYLIQNLAKLAKKHNKQVIVTTHSPAVLDGLNLKDDSQRLFVAKRNDEGYTVTKRILYKSERRMKLSEIWTNGFIGGLPENF